MLHLPSGSVRTVLIQASPKEIIEEYDKPGYGFPNVGLAYIAGYLRSKRRDCMLIDARFLGIKTDDLIRKVCEAQPSVVGFSAMTHQIEDVAVAAAKLRDVLNKDVLFVVGGSHATALPRETLLQYPVFDVAVVGEGEYTFYELVEAFEDQRSFADIKGIAWRDQDKVKVNEPREFIKCLDSLPFPAWDFFPALKMYPVLSSRGCPFQCVFCMRALGNRVRKRSVKNVIEEIEWLVEKFGISFFGFCDETFTSDRKRVFDFARLMIEKGLSKKVKWRAGTRVDCVDLELLQKMKEAGCTAISFGIESGNQRVLENIKKGITLEKAIVAVRLAKEAGLKTATYFIIGHPFETEETIRDTVNFATKLNAGFVVFGIMVPYPGTVVCEMAQKGEGNYKIISSDWRDFNKTIGNSLELKNISRHELEKKQLYAYLHFYLHNLRIRDLTRIFLNNWRVVVLYIKKFLKGYIV